MRLRRRRAQSVDLEELREITADLRSCVENLQQERQDFVDTLNLMVKGLRELADLLEEEYSRRGDLRLIRPRRGDDPGGDDPA